MMRMWQGAVGVAPIDGLVSPAYVVARPFPEADAAYYAYLFRTTVYLREIDVFSRGIVPDRNRLYWESFKQMPSIYPPLHEQRMIVRFLDWYGSETTKLIRVKQKLFKLVTEERQALTYDVMKSRGTRSVRLGLVVDRVFREVSREVGLLYTPIGLYNRGRGIFHKAPTWGEDLGDSIFSWLEDRDLILSGQFAWEGAVSLADSEDAGCVASHRYHILRNNPEIIQAAYLLSFFKSSLGDLLLNEHSRGAAGRNKPLNIITLLKENIPIPPLTEQIRLVELVIHEKQLAIAVQRLSEKLRENFARVSSDIVTGKLDVRAAAAALPDVSSNVELETSESSDADFEDADEMETEEAA